MGESVVEGTIIRWLKSEGDTVTEDEPLVEISTDKIDTELPSPASGVLKKIVAAPDQTVEVGAEIAVIDDGGGAPADSKGKDSKGKEPTEAPKEEPKEAQPEAEKPQPA